MNINDNNIIYKGNINNDNETVNVFNNEGEKDNNK